ncbi:MAG: cytochrome c [Alphaproteobacteria bacterium]|nr:cytochrome c [Alphaproteobacteria bacterium]
MFIARTVLLTLAAAATTLASAAAYAQAAPELIGVRQGVMRSFNAQMGIVAAVGRGEITNTKLIEPVAAAINSIAKQLPALFPAGTGAEAGVRTRAKPEIWSKRADFVAAAAKLDEETTKLSAAIATGNAPAIAAAATSVTNNACNACHGVYRAAAQ